MNGVVTVKHIPASKFHCQGTALSDVIEDLMRPVTVSIPRQAVVPVYADGAFITPHWLGLDTARVTLTGILAATEAGEYEVTAKLGPRSIWPDGTTDSKTLQWRIDRAPGQISLDKTTLALTDDAVTGYVTVARAGNGLISAQSSAPSIATVTVDGEQIIVTGLESGSATVTVTAGQGANHEAVSSTISVNVSITPVSTVFAENSWETIQKVTQKGDASKWWQVGDIKPIVVSSSTVMGVNLAGEYNTVIAGFNHNASVEGNNTLHLILPRKTNTDVAWVGSSYEQHITNLPGICMNPKSANSASYGGNAGGWETCRMRTAGMSDLLIALPKELRDVIKPCTKYTSNGANNAHKTAAEVTATPDSLFLLAEFEVFGVRTYANPYEQDKQEQYTYYKNGAAKKRSKSTAVSTSALWYLRSSYASKYTFCCVDANGRVASMSASYSRGMVVGCMIA